MIFSFYLFLNCIKLKHSLSKSVVICQKLDIGTEMLTSK